MRFISLDSWRGIAALSVALFHFNAAWHGYDAGFQKFIHLFVDFFFVLSGLVIAQAYGDRLSTAREGAAFLIRRFGRVWPLHAAVLIGFAAIEGAKWFAVSGLGATAQTPPFAETGAVPASEFPIHLALLHGVGWSNRLTWNTPSWSISAEFWMYAVFAIVTWIGLRAGPTMTRNILMAALGFLAANVLYGSVTAYDLDLTYDGGFARCIYGFTLGFFVDRIRRACPSPPRIAVTGLAETLILVAIGAAALLTAGSPAIVAVPLLIAVAVYIFSFDAGPIARALHAKPFQNLGTWSYSIYMVHGLILFAAGLVVSVLERRTGLPLWHNLPHAGRIVRTLDFGQPWLLDAALIVYLAIVIAVSALTYRWIESPARRAFNLWADRTSQKRTTAAA